MISIHIETYQHLHRTIHLIKKYKKQTNTVLNPTTPLETILPILKNLDFILLMNMNPEFNNQTFIPSILNKNQQLQIKTNQRHPELIIKIDKKIKINNTKTYHKTKIDLFVTKSAIFSTSNYKETIRQLKTTIKT